MIARAIAVGLSIAVIAAALYFALAMKEAEPQTPDKFAIIKCMPSDEMKEKVRTEMLAGLDEALRDQVSNAVSVWMRDDRDQPRRAANGIRQGMRAYVNTRHFILNWNPPLCGTTSP